MTNAIDGSIALFSTTGEALFELLVLAMPAETEALHRLRYPDDAHATRFRPPGVSA